LWIELSKHSRSHANRLKEIKAFAKDFYNPKEDADKEPTKKTKKVKKPGILATFYWLFFIKKDVEVVTSADFHIRAHFPMRPPCFMFSPSMCEKYRAECDITDAAKKMTDLMKSFKVFELSMNIDLEFFRSGSILYYITSREAFDNFEKILWVQGLLINIFLCFDLRIENGIIIDGASAYTWVIYQLTYNIIGISIFVLFLWTGIRFEQNQLECEEAFKIKYPWRNVDHPIWSGQITVIDAFFKEPVVSSMIIHIAAGALALNGNFIANTLHLFL